MLGIVALLGFDNQAASTDVTPSDVAPNVDQAAMVNGAPAGSALPVAPSVTVVVHWIPASTTPGTVPVIAPDVADPVDVTPTVATATPPAEPVVLEATPIVRTVTVQAPASAPAATPTPAPATAPAPAATTSGSG